MRRPLLFCFSEASFRKDRVQQLPPMPADPEITQERLKPYLGRWSPYGPQGW
jgi:hypothetical protein